MNEFICIINVTLNELLVGTNYCHICRAVLCCEIIVYSCRLSTVDASTMFYTLHNPLTPTVAILVQIQKASCARPG